MRFWELLLCNSTSDCLEPAWMASWGSGRSIWIEIALWKQGVSFLEPFKIRGRVRCRMWDLESFYYVIQHQIILKLIVSSWASGLSIWIEIVLWKQGGFLEPFKFKGRSGRMWDFESFYYVIQHQIVLKLLEYHPGVVDCQSELKLFCGNREFYFLKLSKIPERRGGIRDLECFYL